MAKKPFLKWAGNKARLYERLRNALPGGRRLVEPFLGSAAVAIANQDKYGEFLLGEINPDLVSLYEHIRDEGEAFIADSEALFTPENNTKEAYYAFRERFNELERGTRERALLFVYLNRHCFNGLCRYNKSGGFNVPFGRYKKPYHPREEMLNFVAVARNATFHCGDFRDVMCEAGEGDVVYCDPPYVPLSETASFTSYAKDAFGPAEQRALAEEAEAARARGAVVVISNHATPFSRELYQGADAIREFEVARFISANGNRDKAAELLAFYLPEGARLPDVLEDETQRDRPAGEAAA